VADCGLVVAMERGATEVIGRELVVAAARVLECQAMGVVGVADEGPVLVDVASAAGATGSGIENCFSEPVEDALRIAVMVRPPPMSATAVAAAARRRFFFQRATCRRRAARPCEGRAVYSASPEVSARDPAARDPSAGQSPSGYGAGEEGSSVRYPSLVAAGITAVVRRAWAGGAAMSAAYAPHPGHTSAPLVCRRHEEQ
jgi:hypothetical protein